MGFPGSSEGKVSACNVGDLGAIPGLGRPLEKGMAAHSSILAWEFHGLCSPWGHKESDKTERISLSVSSALLSSKQNHCYYIIILRIALILSILLSAKFQLLFKNPDYDGKLPQTEISRALKD